MTPIIQTFTKWIPTDMGWHGTFLGGWAEVYLGGGQEHQNGQYTVCVHGTDDTSVQRWFNTLEEALERFNRLTYIQSEADIADMRPPAPGADCNGWPTPRPVLTGDFVYPEPAEVAFDHWGTPVPWGR